MGVSGQLHIPAASPLEKGTHLLGDWVDPKACVGILEKRKICPCQESNPRSSSP